MEKELIGYSYNGKTFELSELTPVYKEEFKKGDWVWYITQSGDGSGIYSDIEIKTQLIQIEGMGENERYSGLNGSSDFFARTDVGGRNLSIEGIKSRATCEEVRERVVKTINLNDEYAAEIKDGYVKVGCQEIPFSAIKALHKAIKKVK